MKVDLSAELINKIDYRLNGLRWHLIDASALRKTANEIRERIMTEILETDRIVMYVNGFFSDSGIDLKNFITLAKEPSMKKNLNHKQMKALVYALCDYFIEVVLRVLYKKDVSSFYSPKFVAWIRSKLVNIDELQKRFQPLNEKYRAAAMHPELKKLVEQIIETGIAL